MNYDLICVKTINNEISEEIISYFREQEDTRNYTIVGDIYGIFYDSKIVGLITLSPLFGNLSITILIKKDYRGNGIAPYAIEELVHNFGKKYSNIKLFYYDVEPRNISSNRVAQKMNWKQTYSYEEVILEEGGKFFNIYYKENPYYKKLISKC